MSRPLGRSYFQETKVFLMGNAVTTGLFAPADEFEDIQPGDWSKMVVMGAVVRVVEMYATALIWINILIVLAGELLSLVPGDCLGGAPVTFRALPHDVFLIVNLAALIYALFATRYNSSIDLEGNGSELLAAFFFVALSAVANLVHLIALILECIQGTSVFYVQGFAFLITLTVMTGVVVGWQAWIMGRLWVLRNTRYNARIRGWTPGAGMAQLNVAEATAMSPAAKAYEKAPSAPPSAPLLDANVKTPLGSASVTVASAIVPTAYSSSSFSPANMVTGHRVAHTGKTD